MDSTSGYVVSDFISLVKEASVNCVHRKQEIINFEDFQISLNKVQPILKK